MLLQKAAQLLLDHCLEAREDGVVVEGLLCVRAWELQLGGVLVHEAAQRAREGRGAEEVLHVPGGHESAA